MSAAATEEIRWLRLSPKSAAGSPQKLEYSMKGPLYAASAVFEHRGPVAEVHAKAKASFAMRHWEMETFASLPGDTISNFSSYREETRGPNDKSVEWNAKSAQWKSYGEAAPAAPILSAPELLFALSETFDPTVSVYCAFFVAGNRVQALRLTRTSDTMFAGLMRSAEGDLTTAGYKRLNWHEAREFEIEWSPEERIASAIRVKIPALGRLQMKLKR